MIFPELLPFLKTWTLQFCKCDISESITARSLNFYQFIDDDDDDDDKIRLSGDK